ncbi:MAG TPA: glycosyltransferase family 39 protein [Candidatus Sulfomarinibacteraceae bacterium]|nr:glycosyltransferase family 39 protein [Candidatus Sulfomarinibacteraceae bacterium]
MKRWHSLLLLLIVLLAAALRLTGPDWDQYEHFHPDERYITWVATTIEAPEEWASAFSPHGSTFNPFYWPANASSQGVGVLQDEQRNFAYGHLPLYLGVAGTRLVEQVPPSVTQALPQRWLLTRDILNGAGHIEFRHLTAVARALTALVDMLTVVFVFLIGRHLYGTPVGLLAGGLLAVNVMHVQLAHFFTVDPYLTFFTVLALYALVRSAGRVGRLWPSLTLAALAIGLAIGSKFTAVMLFVPLAVVLVLHKGLDRAQAARRMLAAILLSFFVFALTNPFALLDWTCQVVTPSVELGPLTIPAVDWRSCYLDNVLSQSSMVRGGDAFPFTRQYADTLPYLYPVVMQLRWGMGPLLGLAAFTGFGWAVGRAATHMPALRRRLGRTLAEAPRATDAELVLLAWTVPYFLVTGSFYVKFMRYMQPLTPFLMIYAAALLLAIRPRALRYGAAGAVALAALVYAVAFVSMYQTPHPWISASQWIFRNVQPGALLLHEKWDDPLPSSLEVDGVRRRRQEYRQEEVDWLRGAGPADDLSKLRTNLTLLSEADYMVLSSNRGYGVLPRLPQLYPNSHQYHQLLLSGRLGFDVVFVTGRGPHLGPLEIWPDRFAAPGLKPPPLVASYLAQAPRVTLGPADESFTVYDQPLPIILRNTERLTAEEMLERFVVAP